MTDTLNKSTLILAATAEADAQRGDTAREYESIQAQEIEALDNTALEVIDDTRGQLEALDTNEKQNACNKN